MTSALRVPCDFRSVQDYFFDVKHRVMSFHSWTDQSLLIEIKGAKILAALDRIRDQLLYRLMRSQRIGFYYLFEFEKVRSGQKSHVEMFPHE